MNEPWVTAVPAVALAVVVVFAPGLAVLVAGWRWSPLHVLLAPAVSFALSGVAAAAASFAGVDWSVVPLLVATALVAGVAFGVRRWVGRQADAAIPPVHWSGLATAGALVLAALVLGWQSLRAFVGPDAISQTFDNIVHLNTVMYAVETRDSSPFHIGQTSDAPFYPSGWHSVASLLALTLGVSVPVAVNAVNLVIAALVWPASCVALAWAVFRARPAALVGAGVLSTAFGAFPMLLLSFGVLYPNVLGYALAPAALAAAVVVLRQTGARRVTRDVLLLLLVCAGLGLAHPSAFLAFLGCFWLVVGYEVVVRAVRRRTLRAALVGGGLFLALTLVVHLVWRLSTTPFEMSRWPPWATPARVLGEGVLVAPAELPLTFAVLLLLGAGVVEVVRRERYRLAILPFAVALVLFVLAAGFEVGHPLREYVTRPWYHDSFRLAALLPLGAVQVATAGVVALTDLGRRAIAAVPSERSARVLASVGSAVGIVVLVAASQGPNVAEGVDRVRNTYELTDESALLSVDEALLLERLDETVPADALVAGDPWTGTSLAYAIAEREVTEKHVFGQRTDEEIYLDAHLADIAEDPEVCRVVEDLGVDYVLDFGSRNVHDRTDIRDYDGIQDLEPSEHLVLADEEGDARLFRIEGC